MKRQLSPAGGSAGRESIKNQPSITCSSTLTYQFYSDAAHTDPMSVDVRIVDSFFGIPLLVETYNYSGNLVSATLEDPTKRNFKAGTPGW